MSKKNEVSAKRIFRMFTHRKLITCVACVVAFFVSLYLSIKKVQQEEYTASVLLQIGGIESPLIRSDELAIVVSSNDFLKPILSEVKPDRYALNLSVLPVENTHFVRVLCSYTQDQRDSFKVFSAVINRFVDYGNDLYQEQKAMIESDLQRITKQVTHLEEELDVLRRSLSGADEENVLSPRAATVGAELATVQNMGALYEQWNTLFVEQQVIAQKLVGSHPFKVVNTIGESVKKSGFVTVCKIFIFVYGFTIVLLLLGVIFIEMMWQPTEGDA